jgi:uncharacterized repeat protein (TIGR03803 family)
MKRAVKAPCGLCLGRCAYSILLLGAAAATALPAQTYTVLLNFNGTDGGFPHGALVQATNGDLYGTTYAEGADDLGTVFRMTPSGTLTTVHSFSGTDGANPPGGLVQAVNGDFYGTTGGGGANGYGTVFKMTPSGTLTTLYSFCSESGCPDGEGPGAALIQVANGELYGATGSGGANGYGTVFKITPSGTLTTLHSFNGTDGAYPLPGFVQAADGDLYGATSSGGVNSAGTVFKMTPAGVLTSLYSFCNCGDGIDPVGTLVRAVDGNLYGTTYGGGANASGTVFQITTSGALTTIYSFCSQENCTDGEQPVSGLIQATDGYLYGTTSAGGDCGSLGGTVFKVTTGGMLTTLVSFCSEGVWTGYYPAGGLVQSTNGSLYGTTVQGGPDSEGTVFVLSEGLGQFVETRPAAGQSGRFVEILGTDLAGATSVNFGGTAATFTVVSKHLITTNVPAAAKTGKVEVVTPRGTLSSNVSFEVVP